MTEQSSNESPSMAPATHLSINGWNGAFIEQMYADWLRAPDALDDSWKEFFRGFDLARQGEGTPTVKVANTLQGRVDSLIYHYRATGHYAAELDPLGTQRPLPAQLELESFDLTERDLDEEIDPGHMPLASPSQLRDVVDHLQRTYCRHVGVEYLHIEDRNQRRWLQDRMEPCANRPTFEPQVRRRILKHLVEATTLEHFCNARYVGKKRFSLEGAESLIPMLREFMECAGEHDIEVVTIGMAHRGRINVLVNVLRKSYAQLFTEFEESWVEDFLEGGGDVKFHQGYSNDVTTDAGKSLHVTLAANPSHLEFGHSVVLGKARARQRVQHAEDRGQCVPLLIHGDASFPAQGIVSEMFNMAHLDGYTVGGSVHVVVNNQIGFTTDPVDGHSGSYCTDIARMIQAPIFHVNGDDPEACVHAMRLALEFRQEFHNDAVVDLWCYRRHGHNESDEPAYTQPVMYERIATKQPVTDTYGQRLIDDEVLAAEDRDAMVTAVRDALDRSQSDTLEQPVAPRDMPFSTRSAWAGLTQAYDDRPVDTSVDRTRLEAICAALGSTPQGFSPHRKLEKLLAYRGSCMADGQPLDWAMGELLSWGSLLQEDTPVRLTGQDVQRGTISHRHGVLFDAKDGTAHESLNAIDGASARICIHNSPLTESACLGFEYGYSQGDPNMLIIWEAQFGDFANGAQVIIDQFIASAEAKWKRSSGLVLLLPHGYEGQGPEHSSARLGRFLSLCANRNMIVINPTTPAQLFHAMRRQIHRSFRKPLVVMSPKSLLRHPQATSSMEDLTSGTFQPVIDDGNAAPGGVSRVVLCSGKIYYDLIAHRQLVSDGQATAIVRIEELYPLPRAALADVLARYGDAELTWVQEEPENMGAWQFISAALRDEFGRNPTQVCRRAACTPAVASAKMHAREQHAILIKAVGLPVDTDDAEPEERGLFES